MTGARVLGTPQALVPRMPDTEETRVTSNRQGVSQTESQKNHDQEFSPEQRSDEADSPDQHSARIRWTRIGFILFGGIFTICVAIQVFIAGMAVFVDPANWGLHRTFIHVFEILPIIMLALAFVGQMSRSLKLLPVGLWILIMAQYATANMFGSLVAAIHPVNALVIFWIAIIATRRAWQSRSEPAGAAS